ncbi:ABC transporter permease [Candidatus Uhrbacteria bacterium]|nr:ABC transporter permease [Candidatus Uhrbacteria bacterium]
MFVSLMRALKFAVKDFFRNIWLSVITISIVCLALFSFNILAALNFFSQSAVGAVQDKIDVSVYFKSDAEENQLLGLKSTLETLPEVKSVIYISRQMALDSFKEKHAKDPSILKSLDELNDNPLGASLVIKAKNPTDFPAILDVINRPKYENRIQDKNFDDHKEVISKIDAIGNRLRSVGYLLTCIFTLIAILVVFNTIRVIIYTHKDEIKIMKLVGATNWFIRLPYIIQGLLFSIVGLVIVLAVWYSLIGLLEPYINDFFQVTDYSLVTYFNNNFLYLFGSQFLAVLFLNVISSWLAVNRYLKV